MAMMDIVRNLVGKPEQQQEAIPDILDIEKHEIERREHFERLQAALDVAIDMTEDVHGGREIAQAIAEAIRASADNELTTREIIRRVHETQSYANRKIEIEEEQSKRMKSELLDIEELKKEAKKYKAIRLNKIEKQ